MNNKSKITKEYYYSESMAKASCDRFILRMSAFTNESFLKHALAALKNDITEIYKYPGIICNMPDRMKNLELCKIVFQVNPMFLYCIPERIQKQQEFMDLVIEYLYMGEYRTTRSTCDCLKYMMCDELYEACRMIEEVNL